MNQHCGDYTGAPYPASKRLANGRARSGCSPGLLWLTDPLLMVLSSDRWLDQQTVEVAFFETTTSGFKRAAMYDRVIRVGLPAESGDD